MPQKTLLCRCEDVTEPEVRDAIRHGMRDIESIKRYLSVGTGPCQGKNCLAQLAAILMEEGVAAENIQPMVSRPPLAWTPLGAFAGPRGGEGAK